MKRQRRRHGQGSIYRRADGRWVASVSLANARASVYGRTRDEAKQKLEALQVQANPAHGLAPDAAYGVFLERWLELGLKPSVAESSYLVIRRDVQNHVIPRLGKVPLHELTHERLQTFFLGLGKAGYSARLQHTLRMSIRWSLTPAVLWGLILVNPAKRLVLPRVPKHEIRVLSAEEVGRFLRQAARTKYYPLFLLAVVSGLRKGELLGLQWGDVDWKRGSVAVRRRVGISIVRGEQPLKTPKSARNVYLPKTALAALRALRNEQLLQGYQGKSVFPGAKSGRPLTNNVLTRAFHDALSRAKLPRIRFHDLRHTSASLLLLLNVHPKAVSERLGHARVDFTIDCYSHLVPGIQRGANQRLECILGTP